MSLNTTNIRPTNSGAAPTTSSSSAAGRRPSTSSSSNGSTSDGGRISPMSAPALIRISPNGFQFTASKHSSGQVSKLRMKNLWSTPVGYKFKTNAPLRYSVKPVLGVMAPEQTIEVFVRCESWVNPQDRFLLQSVALSEAESEKIDAVSWRALDAHRIVETYIQCSSASSLSLKDQHDDNSSVSSRTSMSSTRSSNSGRSTSSSSRARSTAPQQLVRKGSSATSHGTTPPGPYPTLFGADKKNGRSIHTSSTTSAAHKSNAATATPSHASLWSSLSDLRQSMRTLRTFLAVRQYTKLQVVTVSIICLLLGLLLPFEKLFMMAGSEPKLVRHHGTAAAGPAGVLPVASAAPILAAAPLYKSQAKRVQQSNIVFVERRKEVTTVQQQRQQPAALLLVDSRETADSRPAVAQNEPEGTL